MIIGLCLQDYLAQDYNNAFVIIILTLYDTLLDYVKYQYTQVCIHGIVIISSHIMVAIVKLYNYITHICETLDVLSLSL